MNKELSNVVSYDYGIVGSNETLEKIVSKDEPYVVVDDGEYKGIITKRMIFRSKLDPNKTKVKAVMKKFPLLTPDDNLFRVMEKFISTPAKVLAYYEDGIKGVVLEDDLLKEINRVYNTSELKVKDVMTTDLITIQEDETIGKAIYLLRENNISRLPVMKEDKMVGIVTNHDIITITVYPYKRMKYNPKSKAEKIHTLDQSVRSIMTREVYSLSSNDSVKDAIDMIINQKITGIPVVDNGVLKGILTKTDIINYIYLMLKPKERKDIQIKLPDDLEEYREEVYEIIDDFVSDFEKIQPIRMVFAHFKKQKAKFRGLPLIHVRLRILTDRDFVVASGETWGVEYALANALEKAERIILRNKSKGVEYMDKYLEKIDIE